MTGQTKSPSSTPKTGKTGKPSKTPKLSWLGPGVVLGGLIPMAVMVWDAYSGALGANPVQRSIQQSGLLALVILLASLLCTPLRMVTGWTWPPRIRKALGLLAFLYAALHMILYFAVDHGLDLRIIVEDVVKRPFITIGFAAVIILGILAVTSPKGAVRRLGFVRWQRLHRWVYVAAGLAALHFVLQTKKDLREPLLYAGILAVLLALRVFYSLRKKRARAAMGTVPRSS